MARSHSKDRRRTKRRDRERRLAAFHRAYCAGRLSDEEYRLLAEGK